MSHWWRACDNAVDNAKLILLSDKQHRAWFNLCCVCSQNGGTLPAMDVISIKLRMTAAKVKNIIDEFTALRLIDVALDGTTTMHDWSQHQYKSDVTDPTNAERQGRYRKRHAKPLRNGESNAADTVTLKRPDTDTDTDTDTEREKDTAGAVSSSAKTYAFESGLIRLSEKDFNAWKAAYSYLDLGAELLSLTDFAQKNPERWFFALQGALAKRNREAKLAKERAGKGEFKLMSGIDGVI